jgi:hypothetical protein
MHLILLINVNISLKWKLSEKIKTTLIKWKLWKIYKEAVEQFSLM